MLPHCLLEVQDAAPLLFRVTGNLQLETHTLLLLTVFLRVQEIGKKHKHKRTHNESGGNIAKDSFLRCYRLGLLVQHTLRLGSTCSNRLLTMSRIIAY